MLRRLSWLSGMSIVGVILNHTHGWGLISMFLWTDRYQEVTVPNFDQIGTASYYMLRVVEQLVVFSLPALLFVSGFFVAFAVGRGSSNVNWKVILARTKWLIIPYLVWCSVSILGTVFEGKAESPLAYLHQIVTGTIEGPYYFVPLLVQLYFLSPILVPLAKNRWKELLIVTALIQLIGQLLLYSLIFKPDLPFLPRAFYIPNWLFPMRLFLFSLGIVAGFHMNMFKQWLTRVKWIALTATILLFVAGVIEWELIFRSTHFFIPQETVIDGLFGVSFILAFLAFDSLSLPLTKPLTDLGTKAFGIYLIHVPAQEYTARIIYHAAPSLLAYQLLLLPIVFAAGLWIPILLMKAVARSPVNGYYKYVFG